MPRVSPKTYYGYSGRFKDNVGSKKNKPASPKPKLYECACTLMIPLSNGTFVRHDDPAGFYCPGTGEPKNFWQTVTVISKAK